jgi:cyclic beta-1,2-glucan synthetase
MKLGRLFGASPPLPLWQDHTLIRDELFGLERLEEHARTLAGSQTLMPSGTVGHLLAGRLADNAAFLLKANLAITQRATDRRHTTPAADWLIDNYHLVEMQVREIGIDLPPHYYAELPKLAEGRFQGLPRVFGVAWALIAHSDSRIDLETLQHFLKAYQEVQPLSIGELWAVPITLRIILIENLRRVSESILANSQAREAADSLADRLLGGPGQAGESWADMAATVGQNSVTNAFAAQLTYRLRGLDTNNDTALAWLDKCLELRGATIDRVVQDELQRQSGSTATIQNIVTSLRLIAGIDWGDIFERLCLVDGVLSAGGCFAEMDFATRTLYRAAIEELARGSDVAELDVARRSVTLAAEALARDSKAGREGDCGYYLIAGGRPTLEAAIGFKPRLRLRVGRACRGFGIGGYGGVVVLMALGFLALPIWALAEAGLARDWLVALALLGAVPASDAAVACVNWLSFWGFGATSLPAMEFRDGIPAEARTMIAVPILFTSGHAIAQQIRQLEIHHLASPDGELHFALLSDWTDSPTEQDPEDAALLAAAEAGIDRLNQLYGPAPGGARFLLMHRRRLWNPSEGCWMGWERKRGKLHELNRALRGATDTSFIVRPADRPLPAGVRYVVTLDADTRLPREAVRRMVAKMVHPLNAPRIEPVSGCVIEGYAVLQPRVTPSLPVGKSNTLFQLIFSNSDGIDPYAGAISDVYQDLFAQGSYAGKGIYDVDAFEASLAGRIPDSTLLSHDLLEGIFARAGLASDIAVIEEFPTGYAVAALRQHRWARGDWQLLPWIMPWGGKPADGVLPAGGTRHQHGVPSIGRWKMLDNLRRTLSAPAAVLALAAGFLLPLGLACVWTGFVMVTLACPALLTVLGAVVPHGRFVTWKSYRDDLGLELTRAARLFAMIVILLAHQASLMGDAILRTLFRVLVSRRRLLQWVTAAQTGDAPVLDARGYLGRMIWAPVIGVAVLAVAIAGPPGAWLLALPVCLAWIASPLVAFRASQPWPIPGETRPDVAESDALRANARQTWRYFETFVTAADHALPPDNLQEDPAVVLARRTSPTNIGLYLISAVCAHDFGWEGLHDTATRIEATLATLETMQRFRGHFYNWYDTADLRPLEPKYVSTVDSGNLAGHLIALAQACLQWSGEPDDGRAATAGRADAVRLAQQELAQLREAGTLTAVASQALEAALAALLQDSAADSDTRIAAVTQAAAPLGFCTDLAFWTGAIVRTRNSHRSDRDPATNATLAARLRQIAARAHAMAMAMEFGFLRNDERKLLSIGYRVGEGMLDPNCYDLLASEARLAVFVAIAKGDVLAREWFRLGRTVAPVGHGAALMSWSGSMFEYLMPSLVMRAPTGSLLEESNRRVVHCQIEYGHAHGLPWGISESAYNARDLEYTYQYSNFGIPVLGFKRGLEEDLVVAPYATALAAMIDPKAAVANLATLLRQGGRGRFGFYEAIDYTASRVPVGAKLAVVRAFMAHHQGMTIAAIADSVLGGTMRARFHAEPMIEATELLLQERAPRNPTVALRPPPSPTLHRSGEDATPAGGRRFGSADSPAPISQILSNGSYSAMVTTSGAGYSRWQGLAVTRWREDPTLDPWGSFIYLRDVDTGRLWSAAAQPTRIAPDEYEVAFSEDRAEFARRDGTLSTTMEVLISAEDDAEVRRITLSNSGTLARVIDVTSYAEIVLAPQATDVAHPAFAKMFIQTEFLAEAGALLATRRRRTQSEPEIWAAHLAVADCDRAVETDRARFVGRGHDAASPAAMSGEAELSGSTGTVLDAVFSVRRRVTVPPGGNVRVAFWTMVAGSRDAIVSCVDKHLDAAAFDRASTLAWTQAQVQLRHLKITPSRADLFQRLAGHMLYAGPILRADSDTIRRGSGPQSGLWSLGLSGDLPILLLRIDALDDIEVARDVLQAHGYFKLKRIEVDVVILNEHATSYAQDLQGALDGLLRQLPRSGAATAPGGGAVHMLRADVLEPATRDLLASVARVVLVSNRGSLSDQLGRAERCRPQTAPAAAPDRHTPPAEMAPPVPQLEFFNGIGGFADSGRSYVVVLAPGKVTPMPWINVIANAGFGFQATAEGSGYSWAGNSRENQLTPWSNDPISDAAGEAFHIRDNRSQASWRPTASPGRDRQATYVAHHGRGWSRFERISNGIASALLQYVPVADPIKISRLQLHNTSQITRSLSIYACAEFVLGTSQGVTAAFLQTERDETTGAIFARNPWNAGFGGQVVFFDMGGRQTSLTGDRAEFLGRNGARGDPQAVRSGQPLSGRVGAGLDPCGALMTTVTLEPGARTEILVLLGAAADTATAEQLIATYRAADLDAVLAEVGQQWETVLGAVTVTTPDRSMDIMLNGWLLYQTLSCRVWARTGFYQASGAYGFRDQLQDGMALTASRPDLVRAHLLRAAGRQFREGDVQHWWLPESGRGVRTRISDDCAWLATTVAHYLEATGDTGVLDERLPFLEAPVLKPEETDRFFLPTTSDEEATLFEHCARALDHSLATGRHGLPLMGTGDWNDGMSRIGEDGQGESVWLGWFLHAALVAFAPIAAGRNETSRADAWQAHAKALATALETAWDGDWYLRAYYDDGTPLGSHTDAECSIDAIAQSWSVISGVAPPERAARAMTSLEQHLVRRAEKLLLVLDPPFDKTTHDPGYIKGYPPGLRENGGQYTHAALWSVLGFARLGDGDKAASLFAMLNPINHALTPADVAVYQVEPYVAVADIYSTAPHVGRGGWSWYSGSAGWMQRIGVEEILGVRIDREGLHVRPCVPKAWPGYTVAITWRTARYVITVDNPQRSGQGVATISLDGASLPPESPVKLVDDGATHAVRVTLGAVIPALESVGP